MTSSDLRRNFEIYSQSEHKGKPLLTKKRRMSEPRKDVCNWKQWMLFSVPDMLGHLIFVLQRLASEEQLITMNTKRLCMWMSVWKYFFFRTSKIIEQWVIVENQPLFWASGVLCVVTDTELISYTQAVYFFSIDKMYMSDFLSGDIHIKKSLKDPILLKKGWL